MKKHVRAILTILGILLFASILTLLFFVGIWFSPYITLAVIFGVPLIFMLIMIYKDIIDE